MLRPYKSLSPPRSERACHPERRRREGPARSLNEAPDRRSSGPRRPSRRREPQRESVTYQL